MKKEKLILIVGAAVAIMGLIGAGIAVSKMANQKPADPTVITSVTTTYKPRKNEAPSMTSESTNYQMKKDTDLILVMGVDNRQTLGESDTYVNYSQADVLYLYAIDHKNKTYQAIQISRETMADVQTLTVEGEDFGIDKMQICLAHSYGKNERERCLNTVDSVSKLLFDVPVTHYVSLGMDAISVLNDQVGGVTVTIPAGMDTVDPSFVEGAEVKLQGKQTELFVRSRSQLKDESNVFRMQRQEIFMKAWKQTAKEKMSTDSNLAVNMMLALSNYMYSDMSANSLSDLASKLKDYKDLGTLTPTGEIIEAGEGHLFREFHVDKADLQKKVIELCYEPAPAKQ